MKISKVVNSAQEKFTSFLSNKPMWALWLIFSAISGILFGIFYTAMYLMALHWWIPIIVIVAIGMIWGTLSYKGDISVPKEKSE